MRGDDRQQAGMWSYIAPEQRVPPDHPLRPIRTMVDTILTELSPEFAKLYSPVGRPSIPPEKLLRALLLQVLYSTRSERLPTMRPEVIVIVFKFDDPDRLLEGEYRLVRSYEIYVSPEYARNEHPWIPASEAEQVTARVYRRIGAGS